MVPSRSRGTNSSRLSCWDTTSAAVCSRPAAATRRTTVRAGIRARPAAPSRLLRRLDATRTAFAFGHAASASGGLWAFIHDASQTKRLHTGRAAEGGFTAALLAARGISGPTQVFDDVWGGFFNAFAPASRQPQILLVELGRVWKLMRCSIKPYASCRSNHSTIDAVLHVMAEHRGLAQKVGCIDVRLSRFVANMYGGRDLSTLSSAQMSLPYAVALAWVFGGAELEHYLVPVRQDARLLAAMARVTLHPDPVMPALEEPTVTVSATDGTVVSQHMLVALGAPARPLGDMLLRAKFDALAGVALAREGAARLAEQVLHLDELEDAKTLLPLLGGQAGLHELIC